MSRPDFEMAQNKATEFLLSHKITGLAFDPRNLDLTSDRIIIDTIENYASLTGQDVRCFMGRNIDGCYTVKYADYNIILYSSSDTSTLNHKIFGITHELGHIYCGHTVDGETQEIEANYFAAQVLMPESVIYYIMKVYKNNRITALDLINIFDVSFEAAQKRVTTFNRKGFWNSSAIDKMLVEKYKPFVDYHFGLSTHKNTFLFYEPGSIL